MRICDQRMQEGTTDRCVRLHPHQCTTSRADRHILRMAVTDRSVTSRTVAQHILSIAHHSVSARTIRRRLQQSGLSARRPLLRLPLTQNHRCLRRQWCYERRMWTAECYEIVFNDESRFCLQHHDCRTRVWRHHGEKMLNSCVMHRHTGPAPGIMVWGGIGYHCRTPLVRIAGTLNSQRYISEVLDPVVLPYLQGLPTAIFQQANARSHVERIVQRLFVNRQIELLPWPARSPDLSLIGNMWSMVSQRLTQITSPAATPNQHGLFYGCNFQDSTRVSPAFQDYRHSDENPRTTLLELEQDTGISKTTIGRIVTKDMKLKKTPAKFIPRFLTNEQKLCRLATCENMLEMTRTDPEWKDKIITGDETWVYGHDPETKRQSAEWRGQGEPRPKKSRNKVLLVAFLDNKGIVHHEYLPAGQTVIKEMYLDILRHLRVAIRKKGQKNGLM
ncbi:hypothetical protein LAZ67_14001573, partial [Cordylochernes scorpioides]